MPETDFSLQVRDYIRAGYQALSVDTSELGRCEQELFRLCELGGCQAVLTWDCVVGFVVQAVADDAPESVRQMHNGQLTVSRESVSVNIPGVKRAPAVQAAITHPLEAIKYIRDLPIDQAVVILRNFHVFMRDPAVGTLWQTIVHEAQFNCADAETGKAICRMPLILGTGMEIPSSIKPTLTPVNFSLPSLEDMRCLFQLVDEAVTIDRTQRLGKPAETPAPELAEQICRGLLGLTMSEAKNTLSLCGVRHGSLGTEAVLGTIEAEKASVLQKNSALTYISRERIGSAGDVGGFAECKKWLGVRKLCFSRRAEELGLDRPKGMVLLGIRGTGKSLVAKTSAGILKLPLVILNMGGMLGSHVGESEAKTDDVLRTIDALCGCVLLIDEADKALQGSSGAVTDSGVSQRVFGKLLTWLAEKQSDTFVIMTMNTMKNIPSELFRRGRFDEVFYVDLPDEEERREILQIHLRRRGLDHLKIFPTAADWQPLLTATEQFVGAELEYVVVESRLAAFADRDTGTPTAKELLRAASTVVTTAQLDPDGLAEIREFCKNRARPVHAVLPPPVKGPRRPRVSVGDVENN